MSEATSQPQVPVSQPSEPKMTKKRSRRGNHGKDAFARASLRRICRCAGDMRIRSGVYPVLSKYMTIACETIIKDCASIMEISDTKTLLENHVRVALKNQGVRHLCKQFLFYSISIMSTSGSSTVDRTSRIICAANESRRPCKKRS